MKASLMKPNHAYQHLEPMMQSNEWWIADNHTFDIITEGENGQRHRLYHHRCRSLASLL